jgi:GNAT acetyltransferase-like protein
VPALPARGGLRLIYNPMRITFRVIPAANSEWNELVSRCPHEFYHTAEYHRYAEQSEEGDAFLAVCGGPDKYFLWPFLERPVFSPDDTVRSGWIDITSAYGYPGPLYYQCTADPEFIALALRELREYWLSRGTVTAFTRFNPLLCNHEPIVSEVLDNGSSIQSPASHSRGLLYYGQTVSMDTTLSDAESAHEYKKNLRCEIHRARRLGLTSSEDLCWEHVAHFVTIYHQTMAKNRAFKGYFFSLDNICKLKAALGIHAHLMVTMSECQVAAACIVVEYAGIVQAHLAGINPEFQAISPLKLLLDDIRRWASARGNHTFHLGGGRGGREDSLMAFKGRFSRRRHDFYTGRWVLQPELYDHLLREYLLYAAETGQEVQALDYFPLYRAPLGPIETPLAECAPGKTSPIGGRT